jgi:hypothetical protein
MAIGGLTSEQGQIVNCYGTGNVGLFRRPA